MAFDDIRVLPLSFEQEAMWLDDQADGARDDDLRNRS
jgi:hypothetical protein